MPTAPTDDDVVDELAPEEERKDDENPRPENVFENVDIGTCSSLLQADEGRISVPTDWDGEKKRPLLGATSADKAGLKRMLEEKFEM